MKSNTVKFVVSIVVFLFASLARAATDWSTQDYDLYSGDFNGDGKTDILYIAKDSAKPSGIATSDGTGPNISFQQWPSNYLGIQWYGGLYVAIVGDFNHDGKADVLLQRTTPGDSYLLLADSTGRLTGISQTISNGALGLNWSKDQHTILAGDFNGDGRTDLFLQATSSSGTNAVVLADSNGTFTSGPTQSWTNSSWSAFKWSTANAVISVGDFNGDGKADLLIQSKPKIVMIDYDVSIPVPVYSPNTFGIVLSQGGTTPLQQAGVVQWSRNANGVDWSPNFTTAVVADFNGDGRADILMQSRIPSKPSYLITRNASNTGFDNGVSISANVAITSDSARLIVGNFDGVGGAGLYIQSTSASGTNYFANTVGASISASAHNTTPVVNPSYATAAGATPGSFSVSNAGAAVYQIPIVVPPGIQGVQPNLSLTYSSQIGNGFLGIGWMISGLSRIETCAGGPVNNAGVSIAQYCLDGNRLFPNNYDPDQAPANYTSFSTELQTYSRITQVGSGTTAYFKVERKDGLTYEYGGTSDSHVGPYSGSWLLNRVSDRAGNSMTYTYEGGTLHPVQVDYTTNSSASVSAAFSVKFVWEPRPTSDYVVFNHYNATPITESKRLNRVETYANGSLVRSYQLGYQLGTTQRSQLSSVQECAGGACFAATQFGWQPGGTGYGSEIAVSANGLDETAAGNLYAIDLDGDGRSDLVYPRGSGSTHWWTRAPSNGAGFDAAQDIVSGAGSDADVANAAFLAQSATGGTPRLLVNAPLQQIADGNYPPRYVRPILMGSGVSGFGSPNTSPDAVTDRYWSGDFNGDGTNDAIYTTSLANGNNVFHFDRGDVVSGQINYATNWSAYDPGVALYNPMARSQRGSLQKSVDFNGDRKHDIVAEATTWGNVCQPDGYGGQACFQVEGTFWAAYISTGSGLTLAASGYTGGCDPNTGMYCPVMEVYVGDFNGDGMTDLLSGNNALPNGPARWQIRFGTANGLSAPVDVSLPVELYSGFVSDFNGSGRAQLLYNYGGWQVAQWNEATHDFVSTSTDILPSDATNVRMMDVNGDGLTDVGYFRAGAFRVKIHNGPAPDLVNSTTDGFGNQVSITYSSLNDATVYTSSTASPGQWNEFDVVPAMSIVKQYTRTDGTGGTYATTEHYTGGRQDALRGFLGFEQRDETDQRNGVTKHQNFVVGGSGGTMDFPFTGRIAHEWVTQGDPAKTPISDTTYSYQVVAGQAWEPTYAYVSQSVSKKYEVGGSRNGLWTEQTTSTVNVLDAYGNATDVTTLVEDKDTLLPSPARSFTTNVVQTITNHPDNWCLGRSDRTTTTTTLGDGTSRTQIASHTVDSANCRVTDEITNSTSSGQPTSLSVVIHYDFDSAACGNPSAITTTGYKNNGAALAPRKTQFGYGAACVAPVSIKDPYLQETTRTYNYAFGLKASETNPNHQSDHRATQWTYDGFGRVFNETRIDGTSTSTVYVPCNPANSYCGVSDLRMRADTTTRDTSGNPITTAYSYFDALGRARMQVNPMPLTGELIYVVSTYDSFGRLYTSSAPYVGTAYQGKTVYGYDLVGRQLSAILYDGSGVVVRQSSARYEGRRTVFVDPRSYETEKVSDASGKLRTVKDPTSALLTKYDYYFAATTGNLVSTITDKANNPVTTTTNLAGNLVSSQDPDMGGSTFEYDSLGELTKQTDAKSQVTSFDDYDLLGRPTVRHEVEGDTNFTYGTAGQYAYGKLKSIASGGYSETYDFDTYERSSATHIAIPGEPTYDINYDYQPTTGFLDTVTYPLSTASTRAKVKYDYNARGVKTAVRDYTNNTPGTVYWQITATDAMNQPTSEQLGNGMRVVSAYSAVTGLLSSRQSGTDNGASNRQNLSYLWDASGNLKRRTDNLQAGMYEQFEYDEINRLKDSYRTDGSGTTNNLHVTYDEIGNIKSKSDVGTYTYGSLRPHAVTDAGGNSYSYDSNGNMSTRPGGATVDWYSDNNLKKVTQGSISSQFWYTPNGNRFKQQAVYSSGNETTYYIGGVMDKVVTPTGDTAFRHYIAAGSNAVIVTRWQTSSGSPGAVQTYYVTADHIGSSSAVTDQSGALIVNESFDAFGKRRGANWTGAPTSAEMQAVANATRHGFTAHEELDNLGLIHMNGRVQDPTLGRFLSADPKIQSPEFSQSLNRYSYVWNNPLTMTDPTGFEGCFFSERGCNDTSAFLCGMNPFCETTYLYQEETPTYHAIMQIYRTLARVDTSAPGWDLALKVGNDILEKFGAPTVTLDPVTYVIGFQGAGGIDAGNNSFFKDKVEALRGENGGYGHFYDGNYLNLNNRSQAKHAFTDLSKFLLTHPHTSVLVEGYSRGGNSAVQFVNLAGKNGVAIDGLVTIDPHRLFGNTFTLRYDNVKNSANFYQQNPTDRVYGILPIGNNPYTGSYIFGADNYLITDPEIGHINLPRMLFNTDRYMSIINAVLGQ